MRNGIKILKWVLGLGFFYFYSLIAEPLNFNIKGSAAILVNAQSGAILFEHNAHTPRYPASTTKVATALYALKLKGDETLDLSITAEQDSIVSLPQEAKRKSNYTTSPYWLEPDGCHIGIKKGEILTLNDLLKGMLIVSGNDAANVIAQALGPSIPRFMDGLNAYLKELGCQNTYFCNPHGLHDPKHQSTAYDLALITQEALKYPIFSAIVSQTRFIRPKTNKQGSTTLLQTNRLLRPGKYYYSRAIGVKTGYHAKAQKNFIGAAQANGRTLIAILLGYQDRNAMFEDAIKLFETAFNQPKIQRNYLKSGTQTFTQHLPKINRPLQTYLAEDLSLEYYPAEDPQAKCFLYWYPLNPPIFKDEKVGEIQLVSVKGELLKNIPLLAVEDVQLAWFYQWSAFLSSSWIWIGGGIITLFLLGIIFKTAAL